MSASMPALAHTSSHIRTRMHLGTYPGRMHTHIYTGVICLAARLMCSAAREPREAGSGGCEARIERDIGEMLRRVMGLPAGTLERVLPALAHHVCALVDQNVELLSAHSWAQHPATVPPNGDACVQEQGMGGGGREAGLGGGGGEVGDLVEGVLAYLQACLSLLLAPEGEGSVEGGGVEDKADTTALQLRILGVVEVLQLSSKSLCPKHFQLALGLLEMLAWRSGHAHVHRRAMDSLYGIHHLLCKKALSSGAVGEPPAWTSSSSTSSSSTSSSNISSSNTFLLASAAASAAATCAAAAGPAPGAAAGEDGVVVGFGARDGWDHYQHSHPSAHSVSTHPSHISAHSFATRGGEGTARLSDSRADSVGVAGVDGVEACAPGVDTVESCAPSASAAHTSVPSGAGGGVGDAAGPGSAASRGLFERLFGWRAGDGDPGSSVADAAGVAGQRMDERPLPAKTKGDRLLKGNGDTTEPAVAKALEQEAVWEHEATEASLAAVSRSNVTVSRSKVTCFPDHARSCQRPETATEGGEIGGWDSLEPDGSRLWQRWALVVTALSAQCRTLETAEGAYARQRLECARQRQAYAVHLLERLFLPGERTSMEAAITALPADAWLFVFDRILWALPREVVKKGAASGRTYATAAGSTDERTHVLRIWLLQCSVLLRYQHAITKLPVFACIWRQFLEETREWYTWSQRPRPAGRGGEVEDIVGVMAAESVREYLANLVAVLASGGAFAQVSFSLDRVPVLRVRVVGVGDAHVRQACTLLYGQACAFLFALPASLRSPRCSARVRKRRA